MRRWIACMIPTADFQPMGSTCKTKYPHPESPLPPASRALASLARLLPVKSESLIRIPTAKYLHHARGSLNR